MPLEVATYISDLVTTNPDSDDKVGTADDHVRLTKVVLKNSFPNFTGEMRATHTALNFLTAVSQDVQAALDAISATLVVIGNAVGSSSGNVLELAASVGALNTDVGALEASVSALNTSRVWLSASVVDLRSEVDALQSDYTQKAFKMGGSATLASEPAGWSAVRNSSGNYTVTTDYNASADERMIFGNIDTNGFYIITCVDFAGGTDFDVFCKNLAGSYVDVATMITVIRKP